MTPGLINVAVCQFAVGGDLARNARAVARQMRQARDRGADVACFPESALTGYAGSPDRPDWRGFDWDHLRRRHEQIAELAGRLGLWVVVGSAHPLGRARPHNCVYVIDAAGRLVERYDKRFCTGGDLRHYSPGDHLCVFEINAVRCGVMVCYDVRFPELYRAYYRRGVRLMFHPFHNARNDSPRGIWSTIMRPTVQAHAAINNMFVAAPNSSARWSLWPSVMVNPDGRIAAQLGWNRAGVAVCPVDVNAAYYDASRPFRDRALRGVLHSGRTVRHPRSRDRRAF